MVSQEQFLDVIDRQEAEQRFHDAIRMEVLSAETIPIADSLGRVLAEDVQATVDVPSFDRSNYDGFAVRAANTFGAGEEVPMQLRLADEVIATAVVPTVEIESAMAAAIATGGMVPRGADAIVMVEHADVLEKRCYPVPGIIDERVARIRLKASGVSYDTLTEDQQQYLFDWEALIR